MKVLKYPIRLFLNFQHFFFDLLLYFEANLLLLQIIYMAFSRLRRHYDRAYNSSFHQNTKSIQYNATLAITGTIRGSLKEKFCQELGFESLQQRRRYRKLCCLFEIIKNRSPSYLFQLVPSSNSIYLTRHFEHNFFKNSFFPSTING